MRLIDADALIEQFDPGFGEILVDICSVLEDAPTIEAEPVVHAHWIDRDHGYQMCSRCFAECEEEDDIPFRTYPYCPFCGALMDEEEDDA